MNNNQVKKRHLTRLKLNSLLEITKGINKNLGADELYSLYRNVLVNQLGFSVFALFSFKDKWDCVAEVGAGEAIEKIHPATDLEIYKDVVIVDKEAISPISFFDIVIPVFHKENALSYLLVGGLSQEYIPKFIKKHIDFLQTLTNIITVANENKKLYKENVKQEAMKRELQLAAELQGMLIPSRFPNNESIEIDALYNSHTEIGGDYYDFFVLPDGEIAFCIADVSGKGIPAAMLMSNFQATLRVLSTFKTSLVEIVLELNRRVMLNAKGDRFITLFIAKYNPTTRALTYINAGHNPPLLLQANQTEQLKFGSIALGMFEELPRVNETTIEIKPESVIVCYTDGVVELENEENEQFGLPNLANIMLENKLNSMKDLNSVFQFKLEAFRGERDFTDDIAILSCRFR